MMRSVLAALIALWLPQAALAAPLEKTFLPAGSEWCLHVDLDAVQQSARLMNPLGEFLNTHDYLRRMPTDLEFLKQAKWHGLTILQLPADEAAVMVHVQVDHDRLIAVLQNESGYARVTYGSGHVIHHWLIDNRQDSGWLSEVLEHRSSDPDDAQASKDPRPIYVCHARPGHYVVSAQLASLTKVLDVVDGSAATIEAERFQLLAQHAGAVGQYHWFGTERPVDKSSQPTATLNPKCLQLIVRVDDRFHLHSRWDLGTEAMADMAMSMLRPESVLTFYQSFQSQLKTADGGEKPESVINKSGTEEGQPQRGRITFGASFKGKDANEDADIILNHLKRYLRTEREETIITAEWTSYADAKYTYSNEDGMHSYSFMLELLTDDQEVARTNDKQPATKIKR